MSSNISEVDRTNIIAFEVSKASLTVHSLPDDKQMTIPNTAQAIKRVLKTARSDRPPFIVCEASGGYERQVLECCVELGTPIHRAHGTRTRNVAKYLGLKVHGRYFKPKEGVVLVASARQKGSQRSLFHVRTFDCC